MAKFIPGLELAHAFYRDVLTGILGDVPHSAAALGEGSEILGFDTERSTDHSWGPRAQIFVEADAVEGVQARIDAQLPETYRGWPVRYHRWQTNRVEHHVEVVTLHDWLQKQLGLDPRSSMKAGTWLSIPQQLLVEVTAGRVFRDDSGELTKVRDLLDWYPHDVWLWVMACQWHSLQQDEPFIGRTAELGDELGSRLIADRIVENAVHLCFLQECRYAPYAKWLGTAFARLDAAKAMGSLLDDASAAADFAGRERALLRLYGAMAQRQNALGVTPSLSTETRPFEVGINDVVRPFPVLDAGRFAEACLAAVRDEHLRRLPLVGSIDQLADPTDLLIHFTDWPRQLSAIYQCQLGELPDSADQRPRTDE